MTKKITLCLLAFVASNHVSMGQVTEISQGWTSFVQSIDASFLKKKIKFRLTASIKILAKDSLVNARIWSRVVNKNGEEFYFSQKADPTGQPEKWNMYTLEGTLDEYTSKLYYGGEIQENGKYLYDNFELKIENDQGEMQIVDIPNPGFEKPIEKNSIPEWREGTDPLWPIRVIGFTFSSAKDHTAGKLALMIEGKGIQKDTTRLIGPAKGFTPQIGTLVMMLNNLSKRVESAVQQINQEETDHFMDEKANSIGSLVMHLAAAEAYYQVRTFENREFNEEEEKIWRMPLDLGEKGRQQLTGHDISYYLNIYKEVRKKTLVEFAKRDDAWLATEIKDWGVNYYYCWFHVMEHQSSHLGQIRMLKKRLPLREEELEIKVKMDH